MLWQNGRSDGFLKMSQCWVINGSERVTFRWPVPGHCTCRRAGLPGAPGQGAAFVPIELLEVAAASANSAS